MSESIQLKEITNVPYIKQNDDIGQILVKAAQKSGIVFQENDIICVASKAVSSAEGRLKNLSEVKVSEVAEQFHKKVPRKDPRTVQVIIDETGAPDGSRIDLSDNYIAGWLPNGLRLTSSGVDKNGPEEVILLPKDADESARVIGNAILEATGVNVSIIISDSDGRADKRGATQIAIGVYGLPPIRFTEATDVITGKTKTTEETVCDMLAASAALIMGQRGTNKPAVLIRGYEYKFDKNSNIRQALN